MGKTRKQKMLSMNKRFDLIKNEMKVLEEQINSLNSQKDEFSEIIKKSLNYLNNQQNQINLLKTIIFIPTRALFINCPVVLTVDENIFFVYNYEINDFVEIKTRFGLQKIKKVNNEYVIDQE